MAREFYLSNLETTREKLPLVDVHPFEVPNTDFEGWDPILGGKAHAHGRLKGSLNRFSLPSSYIDKHFFVCRGGTGASRSTKREC